MNTILADSLSALADDLEKALATEENLTTAVISVLKSMMADHGQVIFGGDGYSSEWHEAAVAERGLKNLPTTADALPYLQDPAIVELFSSTGVLSETELASRFEVYAEQYILSIEVESKLVIEMATTSIYPAALAQISEAVETTTAAKGLGLELADNGLSATTTAANAMMAAVDKLSAALASHDFADTPAHLRHCADVLCPLMLEVRGYADTLEGLVSDGKWPLPKYREMLNIK